MRTITQTVVSTCINEFHFDTEDTSPCFIVDSFTNWLFDYISSGAEFIDGQTLQYGYTLLNCRIQSRVLRLLAPDFQSMPIKWIDNLGPVFGVVAAHKYIPESFGLTADIPTLLNSVLVGNRFDEFPMFANRLLPVESNPNDSGWFIGSNLEDVNNNDPDQLRVMSLYEAMLAVPHIMSFLSLPVGCQVVFPRSGTPVVLQNYEQLEIPNGSYFDRTFRAQSS